MPADVSQVNQLHRPWLRWQKLLVSAELGTVGTQGAMFGLQALHSVMLARILGPEGRGEYGTVMLYSQTLMFAGLLGITYPLARRAGLSAAAARTLAPSAVRAGLTTGVISVVVVAVLSLCALPVGKQHLSWLCMGVALMLPFEHARLSLLAVDQGAGHFRRYNYNRLLQAALFPIMLFGWWWWSESMSIAVIATLTVLNSALSLGGLISAHGQTAIVRTHQPAVTTLLSEGAPYALGYVAAQLLGRLDVMLVLWLFDFTDQGLFAVAMAAASLMAVVPNALAVFSFNQAVKREDELRPRQLLATLLAVLGIQLVSALGMVFILYGVLPVLFGEKYVNATSLAVALLPGLAVEGVAIVAEGYLRGRGRPLKTLAPRCIGAIVLLAMTAFLFPQWQTLSVPIASSVGHAVGGIVMIWIVLRKQGQFSLQNRQESR